MPTYNSINSNVQGNNTFLGSGSGNITLTGDFNIGIGSETLNSLTTGLENVGIGYNSLTALVSGQQNVCLGNVSGTAMTTADYNTAIGTSALKALTTGADNTALGTDALNALLTGAKNLALGSLAASTYTGAESSNICIGNIGVVADANTIRLGTDGGGLGQQDTCHIAGDVTTARSITSTTGNITASVGNVVITAGNLNLPNTNAAGTEGEIRLNNVRWLSNFGVTNNFVGGASGNTTLTGLQNAGFGGASLADLATGSDNSFCGFGSGSSITDGLRNSGLGTGTLTALLTGSDNIGIGYGAGATYNAAQSSNICIGSVGDVADNNIIRLGTDGAAAGQQTDCYIAGNTRVTRNLMLPNTNGAGTVGEITFNGNRWVSNYGTNNTFVGEGSGNTSLNVPAAVQNTALGTGALSAVTTGAQSVAIGNGTLISSTTPGINTAVGCSVLPGLTTGGGNTAVGAFAFTSLGTGSNNIGLSANAIKAGNAYNGAESNNLLIANVGVVGESNKLRIGTTGAGAGQQDKCFIAGTTGVTPDTADAKLMIMDSLGQMGTLGAATNGQIAIGSTGANPVLAAITAGAGINVTNGAGSIAIAAIGSGLVTWSTQAANMDAVVNEGYVANKAGSLEFLLPAAAAVGSTIRITGINTALGWKVTQRAGQTIYLGALTSTTGVAGFIASTAIRDSVELVCVVTDTDWNVVSAVGNITVS